MRPGTGHRTETVLIVEDVSLVRMIIAEMLDELGCTVLEAPDGVTGIRTLEANACIDLLITDVGLPDGMDGYEVAKIALALQPTLKILFITGDPANIAKIKDAGLDLDFLVKPFTSKALSQKIVDILDRA